MYNAARAVALVGRSRAAAGRQGGAPGRCRVKFGLTLPNRGVLMGAITVDQMLRMAEIADASPHI